MDVLRSGSLRALLAPVVSSPKGSFFALWDATQWFLSNKEGTTVQDEIVRRNVALDRETERILMNMAKRYDGNCSLTLRLLLREAAVKASTQTGRPEVMKMQGR